MTIAGLSLTAAAGIPVKNIQSVSTGEDIDKQTIFHENKFISSDDRTGIASIKAVYDKSMGIIELTCHETKEVSVCILDKNGNTLDYDIIDPNFSPLFILDAPVKPGTYIIAASSPVIYAEGVFTVR